MSETGVVKGFKVFDADWTCRGKQYTCPGIFEEDVAPSVCHRGMHFCREAADCFNYYRFDPKNKVAAVIAPADCTVEVGDKCATNRLGIVREIPWAELLELVNTGKGCTGLRNSGNRNRGNWNSGDRNSGNWNSGDWNKTDFSSGCFNTVEPKIYLFNKTSEWTYRDWLKSDARCILKGCPAGVLGYVRFEDMSDEEKAAHPEAKVTGGYLKQMDTSERASIWWRKLSKQEKSRILEIPNFDRKIFKEITGVDVDMDVEDNA